MVSLVLLVGTALLVGMGSLGFLVETDVPVPLGFLVTKDLLEGPGLPGPQGLLGPQGPTGGGAMYVRWGKRSCPRIEGTKMMYSGFAGGTHYTHEGGGANLLCMPAEPEYTLDHRPGVGGYSLMYKVDYAYPTRIHIQHRSVPCAVCHVSTRPAIFMIPAKTTCPSSWTREYYGYIMSSYAGEGRGRLLFECVDKDYEALPGSMNGANNDLLHHVEASCGDNGFPCPPYDEQKEINCVVCTK